MKFKVIYHRMLRLGVICNKIDKPLVVYRFSVHNSVAYMMTNYNTFTAEIRFQSNLNVI